MGDVVDCAAPHPSTSSERIGGRERESAREALFRVNWNEWYVESPKIRSEQKMFRQSGDRN